MGITSALARRVTGISRLRRRRMMSSTSSSSIGSDVSPWLMLQPAFDKQHLFIHRFYSVEENEIVNLKAVGGDAVLRSICYRIPKYVGSSHGWLASYDREKRTMFLSDPVRGRSIELLTAGEDVSRVIFSSSPDDGDCRVLMIYGPDQRLALGSDSKWSPLGRGRGYDNFAYSSRRGTFFCLTYDDDGGGGKYALQSWDVTDPDSPRIEFDLSLEFGGNKKLDDYSGYKKEECASYKYLVVDEEADDRVFLVVRRALVALLPDGSYNPSNIHYSESRGWNIGYAHKTVDFDVYEIDIERKTVRYMESSLDGLALFVGINQPFAVRPSSSSSSQLQPNSIYFTDLPEFAPNRQTSHDMGDNGVFNYQSKTLSSSFLLEDDSRIDVRSCVIRKLLSGPLPLWYIPYLARKMSSLSLFVGNGRRSMSSSSRVSPSPCLVLQPQFVNNEMMYRFYSLEKQKVVNWSKRGGGGGGGEGEVPADASKIVGSSHGWLGLFNESNNELFLSDPLKRRHIRLPSIDKLPDPEINLIGGRGTVSKLILSCPPDHDGVDGAQCRALMSYGAGERLAFCSPLSSTHWLPVGDLLIESAFTDTILQGRAWQDFVYCSRRKAFSCITPSLKIGIDVDGYVYQEYREHKCQWHELDLSPRWVRVKYLEDFLNDDDEPMPTWIETEKKKKTKNWPIQTSHLVYAEETDKLYALVRLFNGDPPVPYHRIFNDRYSINDPYVISKYGEEVLPYKTVGFVALRFDDSENGFSPSVPNSLDGLAMFVGVNHSFAISASKYPELNLKPNSIYFTDVGSRINGPGWSGDEYGGVDAGIFDYQNNVVLPWFDKSSDSVPHAPLWYTPNIDFD